MHLARLRVGTEKENALSNYYKSYAFRPRSENFHRLPT